ncbi:hypothetical protein SLEP1_g56669 [Rubroshorea leprosula]|uniref:Retrotransposon gag domain-containing protein n=1 Tax=Rubroshorea leprosula TaxID=152421 RepID=A0AAV5MKG4_9ROSI|nr:hypothetical protein SLEP1_g56669 [Rubroshorea leprosula]
MDSLEKKNSKGKRVNLELECPPLSKKNKSHKDGFSVQTKRPCVKDLVDAWNSLSNLDKVRFDKKFGRIADVLQVEPDWEIIRASLRFYVPHLRCFVFPEFELVSTIEEYFQLLFSRPEMSSEVYVPDPVNFQLNKLQFQSILQRILSFPLEFTEGCIMKKNEVWGVNWNMMYSKLKFDLSSLSEEDQLNFVALGIYGMVILPTNMDSISSSVVAMFGQLIKDPNLNVNVSTIREFGILQKRNQLEKKMADQWHQQFLNLRSEDIVWCVTWLKSTDYFYPPRGHNWIPLLGVRGAISYSSTLLMRQFRDRQSKPLLASITSYGFDYSLDTQVINQIGFAKEVWSQCEVRFSRNKISITSEFEEWRKVWLQDIVIPYDIPIIKEAIIVDLKKRIAELEGLSCAQRVKHENEIREKNMDIYFLEGEKQKLIKEKNSITFEKEEAEKEIGKQAQTLKKLRRIIQKEERQNDHLMSDKNKLEDELNQAKDQSASLKTLINQQQGEIDRLKGFENEVENLLDNKLQLLQKLEEAQNNEELIKEKLALMQTRQFYQSEKIGGLEAEVRSLEGQLGEALATIDQLKREGGKVLYLVNGIYSEAMKVERTIPPNQHDAASNFVEGLSRRIRDYCEHELETIEALARKMADEANLEKAALDNQVENMENTLKELMASFQSLQATLVTRAPLTTNPLFEGNVPVANLPMATSALTLGKEPMSSGPPNPIIGGTSGTKPFVLNAGVAIVQSNGQEEIQVVKKMAPYANDEKLMIHYFQDSLTGPADAWFSTIDKSKVKSWHDLTYNFMKQYEYNTSLAPSREDLQKTEKKPSESFKEFAQRWRGLAARVQPPLTDHELSSLFIKSTKGPYREKLITCVNYTFAQLVVVGEQVEDGIKSGIIMDYQAMKSLLEQYQNGSSGASSSRKFNNRFQAPTYQSTTFTSQPRTVYASGVNRPQQVRRHFDKLPLSYTEVFRQLVEAGIVTPVPMVSVKPPFPAWYNPQARCEYHSGGVGHDLENCLALKHRVQDLIDAKELQIASEQKVVGSNITKNPLPTHDSSTINMIEKDFKEGQEVAAVTFTNQVSSTPR